MFNVSLVEKLSFTKRVISVIVLYRQIAVNDKVPAAVNDAGDNLFTCVNDVGKKY
jgi:hypothetical protein